MDTGDAEPGAGRNRSHGTACNAQYAGIGGRGHDGPLRGIYLSGEDYAFIEKVFQAVGRVVVLPERMFDGVIAVCGSSPAYLYMMLEAMGDGAVREGIPRKTAYELAAQAMLGCAKMVLETGAHPGALKDAVCSPAGTTIEGVAALERAGFRSAVLEAMAACADKSREMSK